MEQKRHEVLGCVFNGPSELWANAYADELLGLGNYSRPFGSIYREHDVRNAVGAMAMYHLGYSLRRPPEECLAVGFDVAVDYFCGDWCKHSRDGEVVDKVHHRDRLCWVQTFANSLLLGLLSERWDDLARICNWVEADLPPEYTGGDYEDELVHVYRSLAAGLRTEPMPGLEAVEASILKCRTLRPKLLFQAWSAARAGDNAGFQTAFLKALAHFAKNFRPTEAPYAYAIPIEWTAPHHTVVALAAQRLGMKLPELTEKQQAWIMTRETVGLSSR